MRERKRSTPEAPEKKPRDVQLGDNRKATFDYAIEERIEAGIALTGTEIKSLRAGRVNLRDGYARIEHGQAWLRNVHIAPWTHAAHDNHEPLRPRRLLLHRSEIGHLAGSGARRSSSAWRAGSGATRSVTSSRSARPRARWTRRSAAASPAALSWSRRTPAPPTPRAPGACGRGSGPPRGTATRSPRS